MQSDPHGPSTASAERTLESPDSVEGLRDALLSHAGSVDVVGGGTSLGFANHSEPADLSLSTRNLNSVLHYEPADMTVAVEPGVTLAELNQILGEHNQIVPLDAHKPEQATVGGLFASGLAGPRRFRYGSLRDLVIGVEVLGPDGVLTKSGGMVVKNVTGYDMARLHHGAHGSFGIITRLNLKVLPRERASRSILLTFDSVQHAFAAATAVIRSQQEPTAVTVSASDGWQVAVVCDGPEAIVEAQAEEIARICSAEREPRDAEILHGQDAALADFLSIIDVEAHPALARLSVPASRQLEVVQTLAILAGSSTCADPGSGLIYTAGVPSIEWREAIRRIVPESVFLSLPGDLKEGIDVFGPVDAHSLRLLQRLKSAFDPDRRLNRGRFISGI